MSIQVSQYLEFKEIPAPALKTKVVDVLSKRSGERLAQIRWYGPWRCYTLHPVSMTIWNEQCLMDVTSYINGLKAERANRLDDERSKKMQVATRDHRMARLETNI